MSCGDCFQCINKDKQDELNVITIKEDNNAKKKDETANVNLVNKALAEISNAINDKAVNNATSIADKAIEIIEANKEQNKQIDKFKDNISQILTSAKTQGTIKDDNLAPITKDYKWDVFIQSVNEYVNAMIRQLSNQQNENKNLKRDAKKEKQKLEKEKEKYKKLESELDVVAGGSIFADLAPDIGAITNADNGYHEKNNILGKKTKIHFLSKEGKMLKGNDLTNGYNKNYFNKAKFYSKFGSIYNPIKDLHDIKNLGVENIILAFQKRN